MKEYNVLIPSSLSLKKRIEEFPPDFNYNIDYFYYLISLIAVKSTYNYKEKYDNSNGEFTIEGNEEYISLCSEILKKQPYNYRNHIRYLCKHHPQISNILWRKDYGSRKCFSYCLNGDYSLDTFDIHTITDKKLLKFIKKK